MKDGGSVKVEERVLRNSSLHTLFAGFDHECGALFEVTRHLLYKAVHNPQTRIYGRNIRNFEHKWQWADKYL
jgi:hypothetical protein